MNGLTYLRKILGYSTSKFAKEINVSRTTLWKWESAEGMIPLKVKEEIASRYGCPIDLLDKELAQKEMDILRTIIYSCNIQDNYSELILILQKENQQLREILNQISSILEQYK